MAVKTERYLRKPLYVEAVRVTEANFDEVADWCQGKILVDNTNGPTKGKRYIKVRASHPKNTRQTQAFVGDWILYTDRGYKVYTHKAFKLAFDKVTPEEAPVSDPRLTGDPVEDAKAEELPAAPAVVDGPGVRELPEGGFEFPDESGPETVPLTTPQGEEVEYVPATPQTIADVVNEQQPVEAAPTPAAATPAPEARLQTETGAENKIKHEPVGQAAKPVTEQAPAVAAAGKRVLSIAEQRQMGQDEVRDLLRTGDVVLAQDLAKQ